MNFLHSAFWPPKRIVCAGLVIVKQHNIPERLEGKKFLIVEESCTWDRLVYWVFVLLWTIS